MLAKVWKDVSIVLFTVALFVTAKDWKITQIFTKRRLNEQTTVHLQNEVLCSLKRGWKVSVHPIVK